MGRDKSLPDESPIVIIDGMVYQYGESSYFNYDIAGWERPERSEWLVEHHSYAKDYWCFQEEQHMLDFLEMLPESGRQRSSEEQKRWRSLTNEERQAELEARPAQLHVQAEERRQERAASPDPDPTPEISFAVNCRHAISAVLCRYLQQSANYSGSFEVAQIARQIRLILRYEQSKYQQAIGNSTPSTLVSVDDSPTRV